MKIVRFRFNGLWNSEYPLVVTRFLDIVQKHNPDAIHLGFAYRRLTAFRGQLERMTVQERANSDSTLLSELDQKRDTLFNIIYQAAKAFQRTPDAAVSDHAHRIVTVFKKHGKGIPAANYTSETKRLFDLVADVRAQPAVMESLEALSLRLPFEQMDEANRAFEAMFVERKVKRAEDERVDARTLRMECDRAITFLWNTIEMCITQYGQENYKTLVETINQFNAYYKQKLTARATRRKAKQAVEKEDAIAPYTAEQS